MTKTIYEPTPRAKEIRACVADKGVISYAEICTAIGKVGTATVKALVDNGYLEIAEIKDVVCPCCGRVKKDVKFYRATNKDF